MPNHIGAFLKASKCFSELGINITRVSYNKAVDSHILFIDAEGTEEQLKKAEKLCKVRVINYNSSERVYDNSIFYNTYVLGLSQTMNLSEKVSQELLVHVNLAMQTLDEQGLSPYRTFDSISKFTELLGASKGKNFNPRISTHRITDNNVTFANEHLM